MDYITHYHLDGELFDYETDIAYPPDDRRRRQAVIHLCSAQKDDWVLDVGSGSGWLSLELARRGCHVVPLDLSLKNLQRIRQKDSNVLPVLADGARLPFVDNTFDWITIIEVVEHLVQPQQTLQELQRVLKPDGRLVICVPYKEKITYYLCIHCNQLTPKNAHLHRFDADSLQQLVTSAGLTVSKKHLFLNKGISLFRLNALWQWLPFPLWQWLDGLTNKMTDKAMYIGVVCVKNEK